RRPSGGPTATTPAPGAARRRGGAPWCTTSAPTTTTPWNEMELEPDSDAEADAPPPPPNLVYIERVAELEQRSDGLRRELAAAHEDERALRAGIHDKNQLVAHLARKAELSGNRSAAAHAGDAPARGGGRSREESTAELENASSRKRRRRTSGSEMTSRTGPAIAIASPYFRPCSVSFPYR
ncbi:unnamed protein product, partial [Prorocentrum cordatum]